MTLLFNPRTQSWPEHFELDSATGVVRGLTATGRTTVRLFSMNEHYRTQVRRLRQA